MTQHVQEPTENFAGVAVILDDQHKKTACHWHMPEFGEKGSGGPLRIAFWRVQAVALSQMIHNRDRPTQRKEGVCFDALKGFR